MCIRDRSTNSQEKVKPKIYEEDVDEEHDIVSVEETVKRGVLHNDRTKLKQGLKERHIKMLTLVGVFGTGLFLSSGGTLKKTGPVGLLIAYLFVGCLLYTSCRPRVAAHLRYVAATFQ